MRACVFSSTTAQQDLDRARKAERDLRRREEQMRKSILDVCFILFVWRARPLWVSRLGQRRSCYERQKNMTQKRALNSWKGDTSKQI